MPTVVHPQSSGAAARTTTTDAELQGGGNKVGDHFEPGEQEEPGNCCEDMAEKASIGRSKQQDDIDRMWTKNAALFEDPDVDVDFRDLMNIKFAEDSGFEDVPKLWVEGQTMKMRVFHAVLALIFVVYNTRFIITSDFATIGERDSTGHEPFLVAKVVWDGFVVTFFPHHHLASGAHNHILIGCMEIMGLLGLYLTALLTFAIIYCPRLLPRYWRMSEEKFESQTTRDQWLACVYLYTDLVPQISCYSGMRLLSYAQPGTISKDINDWKRPARSCFGSILVWSFFIASRVFCCVVGFDMFLTKFRVAKRQGVFALQQSDEFSWHMVLQSFLFMRQVLGVLKIDVLVRERLYVFIFGGPDSMMSPQDKAVQMVWEALTVRRIHRKTRQEYGHVRGFLAFLSVLITFSDEDFQRLTLDPKRE